MKVIFEVSRGLLACALWIFSVPAINLRVAMSPIGKAGARALLVRQCQQFLDICQIRVIREGHPPNLDGGYVYSHNESAFPDLMAYMVSVLEDVDVAAAADVYRVFPFARSAFARIDFEMVRRGDRAATDALIDRVVARVRAGERAGWGGEGRLSGIDGVLRFKIGAALVAIRAGAPVIPIAIYGGHHTMPLWSVRARPGTVRIRFGEPIATDRLTEADARNLADRLQSEVDALYQAMAREDKARKSAN